MANNEIDPYCVKLLIFPVYFFNMDISVNIILTVLKTYIHTGKTDLEGIISQNFDNGLSFVLCYLEERN